MSNLVFKDNLSPSERKLVEHLFRMRQKKPLVASFGSAPEFSEGTGFI